MDNCIISLIIIYILFIIFTYYRKEKFSNIEKEYDNVQTVEKKKAIPAPELKENLSSKKIIYILVFLSKSCPPCKNYDSNIHSKVLDQYKDDDNIIVKRIYNDESPEMFDEYKVEYTPTCHVVSEDKKKSEKTNGVLPGQIDQAVKSVQNN